MTKTLKEKYDNLNSVFQSLMEIIDNDYNEYNSYIKDRTGLIVIRDNKSHNYKIRKGRKEKND